MEGVLGGPGGVRRREQYSPALAGCKLGLLRGATGGGALVPGCGRGCDLVTLVREGGAAVAVGFAPSVQSTSHR